MRLTGRIHVSAGRLALASGLFLAFSTAMVWKQYRLVACNQAIVQREKHSAGLKEDLYRCQEQAQTLADRKRLEDVAAAEFGLAYPRAGDVVYLEKPAAKRTLVPAAFRNFIRRVRS